MTNLRREGSFCGVVVTDDKIKGEEYKVRRKNSYSKKRDQQQKKQCKKKISTFTRKNLLVTHHPSFNACFQTKKDGSQVLNHDDLQALVQKRLNGYQKVIRKQRTNIVGKDKRLFWYENDIEGTNSFSESSKPRNSLNTGERNSSISASSKPNLVSNNIENITNKSIPSTNSTEQHSKRRHDKLKSLPPSTTMKSNTSTIATKLKELKEERKQKKKGDEQQELDNIGKSIDIKLKMLGAKERYVARDNGTNKLKERIRFLKYEIEKVDQTHKTNKQKIEERLDDTRQKIVQKRDLDQINTEEVCSTYCSFANVLKCDLDQVQELMNERRELEKQRMALVDAYDNAINTENSSNNNEENDSNERKSAKTKGKLQQGQKKYDITHDEVEKLISLTNSKIQQRRNKLNAVEEENSLLESRILELQSQIDQVDQKSIDTKRESKQLQLQIDEYINNNIFCETKYRRHRDTAQQDVEEFLPSTSMNDEQRCKNIEKIKDEHEILKMKILELQSGICQVDQRNINTIRDSKEQKINDDTKKPEIQSVSDICCSVNNDDDNDMIIQNHVNRNTLSYYNTISDTLQDNISKVEELKEERKELQKQRKKKLVDLLPRNDRSKCESIPSSTVNAATINTLLALSFSMTLLGLVNINDDNNLDEVDNMDQQRRIGKGETQDKTELQRIKRKMTAAKERYISRGNHQNKLRNRIHELKSQINDVTSMHTSKNDEIKKRMEYAKNKQRKYINMIRMQNDHTATVERLQSILPNLETNLYHAQALKNERDELEKNRRNVILLLLASDSDSNNNYYDTNGDDDSSSSTATSSSSLLSINDELSLSLPPSAVPSAITHGNINDTEKDNYDGWKMNTRDKLQRQQEKDEDYYKEKEELMLIKRNIMIQKMRYKNSCSYHRKVEKQICKLQSQIEEMDVVTEHYSKEQIDIAKKFQNKSRNWKTFVNTQKNPQQHQVPHQLTEEN